MFIKEISFVKYIAFVMLLSSLFVPLSIAMDSRMVVTGREAIGSGKVQGRACVVAGIDQVSKICSGDIVVASTINKSWNRALKSVAGIITEQGGSNSYAVQLGKTLKIPVITGVSGATKKIIDGSSIGFDCTQKIVYEVIGHCTSPVKCNIIRSSIVLQKHGKNYGLSGSDLQIYDHVQYTDSSSDLFKDKKEKINVRKAEGSYYNGISITSDRLLRDKTIIKDYVMGAIKNDIWKAAFVGRWTATWQITGYAYDSIPFEFFVDEKEAEIVFSYLENGANYIQDKKEEFKKTVLGNKTKIDNSQIAEFLYKNVVAHVDVNDQLREELIKDPTKMDKCVQSNVVKRSEYMYYTLLNFVTRYYLEQELQAK
jgi:phosphohistidine swiveling domain-containing protein